jgi:hypothetical protein
VCRLFTILYPNLAFRASPRRFSSMSASLRLLFIFSLLGAAACAAAHALTFADIAFYPILLFVPLLFIVGPLTVWQFRRIPRKNLFSEIFADIPRWMKVSIVILLAYVFANFFLCLRLNQGGDPVRMTETRLVLKSHDKILRELSPADFRTAQAVQVRQLTGHLLVFYALAAFVLYATWLKSGPAMANAKIR